MNSPVGHRPRRLGQRISSKGRSQGLKSTLRSGVSKVHGVSRHVGNVKPGRRESET
jgi:hypothetical protein